MAIIRCPYRVSFENHFDKVCIKSACSLWHEPLEICSHKATALLLYDIHQVMISIGVTQGFVKLPEEDEIEQRKD